jgi:ketosteroid isomerase-like protein
MKKKLFSIFAVVLLLILTTSVFSQTTKEEMMKKVEKWNKQFSDAMVANDKATRLSFYADDAYSLPSYTPMLVGKKAIENSMNMDENSGMKILSFKFNTKDLWMSGDLMCEVGTYDLSLTMGGQSDITRDHGKYLTIYQKQKDGTWKIKADMWNTDTNPFATGQ